MEKLLKKILYIDDEEDIRAIAKIALQEIGGLDLKECASGKEAIKVAESFQPDLLLIDIMMPGLDGIETLTQLKKLPGLKTIPAIFMTAKIKDSLTKKDRKLGVIGIIEKPFDPMTLADSIRGVWKKFQDG